MKGTKIINWSVVLIIIWIGQSKNNRQQILWNLKKLHNCAVVEELLFIGAIEFNKFRSCSCFNKKQIEDVGNG